MMVNHKEKMEEKIRSELLPNEKLHQIMFVSDGPSEWTRRLLIGPIISSMMTKYYYVGLTNRRIIFANSIDPGDYVKQIMLDKIKEMNYQPGVLYGKIKIELIDQTRINLTIDLTNFEEAERFVNTYLNMPKPKRDEKIHDTIYKEQNFQSEETSQIDKSYIIPVVIVLVLLFIIICVAIASEI